ncbi:PREDICTED: uncharacterized protein LOC108377376 isoform X2 [Rhagoletis zephyria]|uniref:uncharacterized protein LOC108377376 isoform X2 n=1 Tax=Rhagoletis zephyria TaxID=28612 RepID=UPI000811AAF6|nr:PREDICTED: uncharacterized protein LOC108377376 isoform X2 [Rhagoletis zephyria]
MFASIHKYFGFVRNQYEIQVQIAIWQPYLQYGQCYVNLNCAHEYQLNAGFAIVNTSKMSKPSKFLFLACLSAVICAFAFSAERKCAEYNEYCQEHWECCSNTCLTYSYRCIGKKRPSLTFGAPSMSFDELLDSIYGANMIPDTSYNRPEIDNRDKSEITLQHLLDANQEWGAQAEEPVLHSRFAAVDGRSETAASSSIPDYIFFVLQPKKVMRQPKQLEEQAQSATKYSPADTAQTVRVDAGEENATESDIVQTTEQQCKEIGAKCYRHEECCTNRCHGFLHQCVT